MSPIYRYSRPILFLLIAILVVSCSARVDLPPGKDIPLAGFTDPVNNVVVSVRLSRNADKTFSLVAIFTPPQGYHLYGKDIPIMGVRGQGRPTLLEIPAGAQVRPAGPLTANQDAELPGYVPDGAAIYPKGPVTLTLPIRLPDQTGWVADRISLTYMACTDSICTPPTVGKLVEIKVPGARSIEQ